MNIDAFDYDLPEGCVAQQPSPRREEARLMVIDRAGSPLTEATFAGLAGFLRAGDLLVLNDTRVLPARLHARKPTGGRVDLLLLGRDDSDADGRTWRCLLSGSRGLRPGARLVVADDLEAEVMAQPVEGAAPVRFACHGAGNGAGRSKEKGAGRVEEAIRRHGVMPLPPYIHRAPRDPLSALDQERYQTVYAAHDGAIAAPTAGLHFTTGLLDELRGRGIATAFLTLHVGAGTFRPVRSAAIEEHVVDPERFRLEEETADAVARCRARKGRVVAVGTTVTRVLEARAREDGQVTPGDGWCDLVIRPGHRFRAVDALVTNLHLPKSSLLILVAAFAGRERILDAYREAVRRGFRFYSYGDAMLIL